MENVDETPERADIYVSTRARALVKCPVCGEKCKIHDQVQGHGGIPRHGRCRMFRHSKDIQIRHPKYNVRHLQAPWARDNIRFTESFKRRTMSLMRKMPHTKAAKFMHVGRWVLERILEHNVHKTLDTIDLSSIRNVLLDEIFMQTQTSIHHRHHGCRHQRHNIHGRGQGFRFSEIVLRLVDSTQQQSVQDKARELQFQQVVPSRHKRAFAKNRYRL